MKSFFSMFSKSARELADPVNIAKTGILIAMSMVLEMFSVPLPFSKLNFAFLAIAVTGMLFGPTVGFTAGLACDIVGYMVNPTGAFLPVYTLVAGLQGLIYGVLLYTKNDGHSIILRNNAENKDIDITLFLRAIAARIIDVIVINLLINTALNMHYGFIPDEAYGEAIIARTAKNVIELAADIPLLFALLPAALLAHKKTGGLKKKKTAGAA